MPKKGMKWPMPKHMDNYLSDPFLAVAKVRVHSKSTITLGELNATDLPPLEHEEELEQETPEDEEEEEEDPFGLGIQTFDGQ